MTTPGAQGQGEAHEHWFHALWSHLGPHGPQDIHYHPCVEGEPGDCYWVLVGPGRDCDGKKETHQRDELPLDDAKYTRPHPELPPPSGAALIAAERRRQVEQEGWTPEHDAEHAQGDLALAAVAYIVHTSSQGDRPWQRWDAWWPWDEDGFKPGCHVRNLVKAGALIAAEIDRLSAAPASPGIPETPK